MSKIDLKSCSLALICEIMEELAQPAFRAKQIFRWIHKENISSFEEMSNLPASLRAELDKKYYISSVSIKKKLISEVDGTIKYLFELEDGNSIETVLMQYNHGTSICVSTQVGCRMGCKFCASTLNGLVRNLTPAEMLNQIYAAGTDTKSKIGSVVLMGIGEPMDNFENVMAFLSTIASPEGYQIGYRHITISTCGFVDKINELAAYELPITLSISLHATNDRSRSEIMPVNNKWRIKKLIAAAKNYFDHTSRRITYEYALLSGVNDSQDDAKDLAALLRGHSCHVNLIPINPIPDNIYKRSKNDFVKRFADILKKHGVPATVRRELGTDINAACGQLRHDNS